MVLAAVAATGLAMPAAAQFASDFPGVPRAAISFSGGKQNRTTWGLSGYKIPGNAAGDTVAGGLRLGFGQSYRIQSQFEVGYDFTLLDGMMVKPPGVTTSTTSSSSSASSPNDLYMRGLTTYGIRIGAKYRPIASLDPDGYGYEVAFGGGFQPELKALYGIEKRGDSTRTGGQFNHDAVKPSALFAQNPFAGLSASTILAGMASYRSKRFLGDAALVAETSPDRAASSDPSPIRRVNGLSARAGGVYRLTPGTAIGASYWGTGSPPWWDEVQINTPGKLKSEQFGFLLQFGSSPESGVDLMLTSPTGKFSESARLYIRFRSTE